MAANPRKIEMGGQRFARWTVLRQQGNAPGGGALWLCECDCGELRAVLGGDLRNGKSRSCGCLKAEVTGAQRRSHGESGTRLHNIWKTMLGRCRSDHPHYGGRGISVCDEWQTYPAFRDWALSSGYKDSLSIERVDVNGNYCPANCTWATALVQSNNRRFVRKTSDGRPAPMVARENGIPSRVFNCRVHAGWSIDEAATHPFGKLRVPRGRDASGRYT